MLCEGVASGIVFGLPSFKEIFGKKNWMKDWKRFWFLKNRLTRRERSVISHK
jgi:hypothetical protein